MLISFSFENVWRVWPKVSALKNCSKLLVIVCHNVCVFVCASAHVKVKKKKRSRKERRGVGNVCSGE